MTLILGGKYKYQPGNEKVQQEIAEIWKVKEELIGEIMAARPESNKSALGFKTPKELEEMLRIIKVIE